MGPKKWVSPHICLRTQTNTVSETKWVNFVLYQTMEKFRKQIIQVYLSHNLLQLTIKMHASKSPRKIFGSEMAQRQVLTYVREMFANYIGTLLLIAWGTPLRHCATNRKVASSLPDGFTGIFHWRNPSGRTMALGLTQPLTEISTRNISWE